MRRDRITNICSSRYGAFYAYYIERPWLAQKILRLALGIDVSPYYRSMQAIADLPDGATVVDAPCGGGVALMAVRPHQSLRYVGIDISEKMLTRFRRRACDLEIDVETIKGDLRDIPLPDGFADLCLSYQGLHMLSNPRHGLAEIVRCLRPGGRLVGATLLAEGARRQRMELKLSSRGGASGAAPRAGDLRSWLVAENLEDVAVAPDRGMAVFTGRRK